jgi:hypothetical protein
MADRDVDSPELRANLNQLIPRALANAVGRVPLMSETARGWHVVMMEGLQVSGEQASCSSTASPRDTDSRRFFVCARVPVMSMEG